MRRLIAAPAGLSCLVLPIPAAETYASIDGAHLKQDVEDLAAYAKIIADLNAVDLEDLQRPAATK
jgi:hypothetical protein